MIERIIKHYKTTVLGLILIGLAIWIAFAELEVSVQTTLVFALGSGGMTLLGLKDNLINSTNGNVNRRTGKVRKTELPKRE